jgi:hypothetical protein
MKVSQELIESKLKNWTLSCKIQETLGLTSMEEALFKKELFALEEKGLLEREGVRRGLKFRYKAPSSFSKSSDDSTEEVQEETTEIEEAQISNIAAFLQQKEHDKKELEKQKSVSDMFSFLLKASPDNDPCINSYTFAIKHTSDGFFVRMYAGILIVSETFYTQDKFIKYLKASGITTNE